MRALVPAMGLCVALVVGTVSAINLAIPSLAGGDLHPTATDVLWVVDGYVVVFACLLVPAGALADRLGRKGVLLSGMALFAGGTGLCAVAPSVALLVVGRVVSGVGASAVLPTTLALMLQSIAEPGRAKVIGVWASMTGIAAVLGNIGGAAAVQWGSWRTLFLAVAPLALVTLVAVAMSTPRAPRHRRAIPLVGGLLLTGGCVALVYALVSAPQHGWSSGRVLLGSGGAVLLLSCWVAHDLRAATPILDPRLFLNPTLRASALGMTVVFVGMFGLMYVNGQYLQYAKGCSVLGAGLRLVPMAGALWLAPRATVPITARFGRRAVVGLGLTVLVCGLVAASFVDAGTPTVGYLLCTVTVATGCGLTTPPLSDGIMSTLPSTGTGTASGLQSVARELGSALGIAVVGSVLTAHVSTPTVEVFTDGMSSGLRVAAAIVAVAGIAVVCWLPRRATVEAAAAADR